MCYLVMDKSLRGHSADLGTLNLDERFMRWSAKDSVDFQNVLELGSGILQPFQLAYLLILESRWWQM